MTLQWKKAIRKKRKYARIFSKERTQETFEMKERRKAVKEYLETKDHRDAK